MDITLLFANLGFSAFGLVVLLLLVLALSAYIKIVTVLGILRVGLGADGIPAAFVTGGLALVLAFFVMYPTIQQSSIEMDKVVKSRPGVVSDQVRAEALNAGLQPWKDFLSFHAHQSEKEKFAELAKEIGLAGAALGDNSERLQAGASESWRVLAPAFLVSELKEAFATGLSLFLPLLVIDLLVVNVMVAVGIDRLSPFVVSLPFKLLLFVMVDGWSLVCSNIVATYAKT